MNDKNGISNVRSICEKAVSAGGLHFTKGYLLWEAYREFENAILMGLDVNLSFKICFYFYLM
jgi:squamous cell carcinoma antigen recognized by T-cells 3